MAGRSKLFAFLGSAAAIAGYTGKVAYENSAQQELFKTSQKYRLNFSPGSADEILLDGLKTGDILLFSRRWYHYHIPQALYIIAYQLLFDTEYDHIGICVCDKYGEPSVFENTFLSGMKSRPFNERIVHSKAHQISLIMLQPREDIPVVDNVPAHRSGPRPARSKIVPTEVRNAALRRDVEEAVAMSSHTPAKVPSLASEPSSASATTNSSSPAAPGSAGAALASLGSGLVAEVAAMLMLMLPGGGGGCYNVRLLQAVYAGLGITLQQPHPQAQAQTQTQADKAPVRKVPVRSSGKSKEGGNKDSHSYGHGACIMTTRHLLSGSESGSMPVGIELVDLAYDEGAVEARRFLSSKLISVRMK